MTDAGIEKYIRKHLAGFGHYSASTSPETLAGKVDVPVEQIIKLDANENPYGCSPRVTEALAACPDFNVYPDDGQQNLKKLLAGYAGAAAENIVASGGSNQLIDLLVRLFVAPGDEVLNCVPTFDLYRFSTEIAGGKVVNVRRKEDYSVDVTALKAAVTSKTRIIFISNPNNPTGNVMPKADIVQLLETGLPVVLDEAYYEFSGQTMIPRMKDYPNLMVLRTFSKWAGLAGLRVGYGAFPPVIADSLMAIKVPYNVNLAAIIAVRESLADLDYLQGRVQAIIGERERLYTELCNITWLKLFPSQANFIYCRVLEGDARDLYLALQKRGILVRFFDNPLLAGGIRISVGKPEHTDAVVSALRQIKL